MSRRTLLAVVAALALPAATHARDRDYDYDDGEWGYVDDVPADVQIDVNAGSSVTFETFQDNLSPYGEWVSAGAYGRVWRPVRVYSGWRPYYDGSWQWTDEGWLWVSSEPWGWATYHYGRWAYDSFYGWVWVPGYQWAPAWVSWRVGGGYIGWAPLGPGVSVYVTNYPVVYDHWCFVPTTRFVGVPVRTVGFVGGPGVGRIWGGTQPAPPRATVAGAPAPAWGGAPRPFVERQVGRPITPVRVQAVATPQAVAAPSRAGVVPVFRPEAARPQPGARGQAPAPTAGAAPSGPPGRGAPQDRAGSNGRGWGAPAPRGDRAPAPQATPQPSTPAPVGGPHMDDRYRGGAPAPSPSRGDDRGRGWGAPAPRGDRAPAPQATPQPSAPAPVGGPHMDDRGRGGSAPAPRGDRAPAPQATPQHSAPAPVGGPHMDDRGRGGAAAPRQQQAQPQRQRGEDHEGNGRGGAAPPR